VGLILHEILGMRKLSARWVPRLLTPDNKRRPLPTLLKRNPKEFLRRLDPLVHTRDQGTVETVDSTRRTCSEEGEDCPIGRKGDGHRFLGFTRCDLHRLPGEGQNGHRAVLCRIIGPIRRRIAENTAPFGEEKVLFHHDNAPAHTSAATEAYFSDLEKTYFSDGFKKFEHRWVKCNEL